jgi:hypothetical protein
VARFLPIALVAALLVGTAAAFAVTERLKLVRSPVAAQAVTKVFSPVCACGKDEASIRFRLREADRIDLAIVDGDNRIVRTLFLDRPERVGTVVAAWDGRDEAGGVVPEGSYRPRLHFDRARRTIVLPNPIAVDTTPPQITLRFVRPRVFSPDGDGRSDKVSVGYALDEPAHGVLFAEGGQVAYTRAQQTEWKVDWNGVDDGRKLRPGDIRLTLAGEDRAGNRSDPIPAGSVRLRYVELARDRVAVPPAVRFGIRVGTDAGTVRWRLAGRTGTSSGPLLVLRSPARPGRYTLFVEAAGHADRATVIVRAR